MLNLVYMQQSHLQQLSRRDIDMTTCKNSTFAIFNWTSYVPHSDYGINFEI